QLGILAEELFAHIGAILSLEGLIFAVDAFLHPPAQKPGLVAREQRIPITAPDHLNHVPAGPAEISLQLLDYLPVAADRTIEALEIAIDDEDQIVQPFTHGQRYRAKRFRLVHLAVAHECPDLAIAHLREAAPLQ